METYFKEVTEEYLSASLVRFYGSGRELKVGDKTIPGMSVRYANLNATPPTRIDPSDVGLVLQLFVLDESTGMLFQLYSKKQIL